jgi:hypothetical protein
MTEILQVPEMELTEVLQETKSTHSSECASGSQDEREIQRKRVCDTNSAPVRAPKSVQLIRIHVIIYFSIKYVVDFLSFTILATISVLL